MTNGHIKRRASALPAELGAGVLAGGLSSLYAVSFAYIVFAGAAAPFVGKGIWVSLLGTFVVGLVPLSQRHYRGSMWQTQSAVAIIVGLASVEIARDLTGQPVATLATILALLAVTALLTGALMGVIGVARLGQIAKSVPYPVVGGFLAATGCLLLLRAVEFALDGEGWIAAVSDPAMMIRWLPPVGAAALILLAERWFKPSVTLLAGAIGVGVAVHVAIAASGMSPEAARAAGVLLDIQVGEGDWGWALTPEMLAQADWKAVFAQYPLIGTAAILAALGTLLNLSAIEFSTGDPVDLDAEMRLAGAANLTLGLGGGFVGYHSATLTQLATGLQTPPSRLVPFASVGIVLAALLAGPELLNLFPRSLFCMLLAYLGLDILRRWLVRERARLPREDYLIVLLILVITLAAGFVWAVAVGVVVASMRFTVAYSRLPVLRSAVTGAVKLSSTERSERATQELVTHGHETLIFEAQGYMFFGTANSLYARVERELERNLQAGVWVRHLVIDMRRVQGVDVSAIFMFDRLARQAHRRGVHVIFAGMEPKEEARIARGIEHGDVQFHASLDHALIALEEEALSRAMVRSEDERLLAFGAGFRTLLEQIEASGAPVDFHSHAVPAGTRIFEMGASSDSLLVLDTGRLYATMRDGDTPAARVATFLPGAVVGEIGLVTGATRTASIVAEIDCTIRIVTREELDALRHHDPELALDLSERIASLMAQRLARTTALLNAVSR